MTAKKKKQAYKIIAIIAMVISIIGLVSFIGGVKPVNIGVFVFPLLISGVAFLRYKKVVTEPNTGGYSE